MRRQILAIAKIVRSLQSAVSLLTIYSISFPYIMYNYSRNGSRYDAVADSNIYVTNNTVVGAARVLGVRRGVEQCVQCYVFLLPLCSTFVGLLLPPPSAGQAPVILNRELSSQTSFRPPFGFPR